MVKVMPTVIPKVPVPVLVPVTVTAKDTAAVLSTGQLQLRVRGALYCPPSMVRPLQMLATLQALPLSPPQISCPA